MNSSITEKHILSLLENYVTNKKTIEALQRVIERAPRASYNEMIEKMAFARTDSPGTAPGYISDKTAYIALHYQQQTAKPTRTRLPILWNSFWNWKTSADGWISLSPF